MGEIEEQAFGLEQAHHEVHVAFAVLGEVAVGIEQLQPAAAKAEIELGAFAGHR